jgi:putative protease
MNHHLHQSFCLLHNLYRNERQSVEVDMSVEIKCDTPIRLTVSDGNHTVSVNGDIPSMAKSKPCDYETVKANLSKLGGTPYRLNEFIANIDDNLYIPLSSLNALRRNATEQLDTLRGSVLEYNLNDLKMSSNFKASDTIPSIIARFDNESQIPENTEVLSGIMLPLESPIPDVLPQGLKLIADVPRGILSESFIKSRLELFKSKGFTHAYCGNLAAVKIAKDLGYQVIGGIGLNAANTSAAEALNDMGVEKITLSPELLLSDIIRLNTKIPKGIFAYGKLPLMLMRNCPVKNGIGCDECKRESTITDRLGVEFPIKCRAGFSELYNSLPIFLADRQNEYNGLDFIILYFTNESPDVISKIIDMYKFGGKPIEKHTRGLYYRSVM